MSIVLQVVTTLASPFTSLGKTVSGSLKNREENKRIKEDLANSLQGEIKEYEAAYKEIAQFGEKIIAILHDIKDTATPNQLIGFIDSMNQIPKILIGQITLFVHMARACKDISENSGFMDSLKTSNRFMYDFSENMGKTYVEKDTVVVDTRFFHFLFMYKREIVKMLKDSGFKSEIDKKEIEFLGEKLDLILKGVRNQRFIRRYINKGPLRKWKISFVQLNKAIEYVKVDSGGMDLSGLNDFMPSGIKEIGEFLNISPPK
jgi:hypothetical protein